MKKALFLVPLLLIPLLIVVFLMVRPGEQNDADLPLESASTELIEATSGALSGRESAIQGRVLLPSGEPVSGAKVLAGASFVRTLEDGSFAIDTLEPGDYRLEAEAEGFVRSGPPGVGSPKVTVLAGGLGVHGVDLILNRPSTISGRVVAAGKPVADAELSLYYVFAEGLDGRQLEPFALSDVGQTNETGDFSLTDVGPGRLRIMVASGDYAFAESKELYLRGGDRRDGVIIDLVSSGSLTGTITSNSGAPLVAEVVLLGSAELGRARRMQSDVQGRFAFSNVPVGSFALSVRARGYRTVGVKDVVVEHGEPSRRDITLEVASGIFGRVVDADGEPAPRAFIIVTAPGQADKLLRANPDGSFEWQDPPPAAWMATATTPFNTASPNTRVVLDEELVLEVGAGGTLAGRVVDARGNPVVTYTLAVERFDAAGPRPFGNAAIGNRQVARADGVFEFGPLQPGTYTLRAQAPGLAPGLSERVVVRAGERRDNVLIRLGEGATLVGTVTSAATGQPLAGATVTLSEPTSALPPNTTRTDANGRYTLEGAPAGRHSLRVTHAQHLSEFSGGLAIPSRGEVRRDVALAARQAGQAFSFHGIGAVLRAGERGIEVANIMDGTPAQAFGLQAGDVIRAVDRENTSDMDLVRVVEMIRGEEGSPVTLEIEREGEGRMTLSLERGRVIVKRNE
ncbi:MAG: carboxypeptidase regulatory-like domain-containing protein [Bradymonadaceae bacterium]|nr:carboxypeptidase regulatory-like domain-containing protein [Lujinxingiaceae bacterium]